MCKILQSSFSDSHLTEVLEAHMTHYMNCVLIGMKISLTEMES